jgi:hypothetical protein
MKKGIIYYGNVTEDVSEIVDNHNQLRIYRINESFTLSLDVQTKNYFSWSPYNEGDAVKWCLKREPSGFNRELNQVWKLVEDTTADNRYYIKDCTESFYLCYRANKSLFLSNQRGDNKVYFKYDK